MRARKSNLTVRHSPLVLELLEALPGQVTSDVGLEPGDDLAETVVTQLLHLTQDTGAEEHLEPNTEWSETTPTAASTRVTTTSTK